jgi:hypothetical protein
LHGCREAVTKMLDAFIIEEIKRRDREQSRDDRPVVELPVPPPPPDREQRRDDDDNRGVVIIDYAG